MQNSVVNRLAQTRLLAILLVMAVTLSSCVGASRITYSAVDAQSAEVPGFSNLRVYLDADAPLPKADLWKPRTLSKKQTLLVISGGGAGGAFGVGILAAWSKMQTRPIFDMVTGVSTGALIAPYAFLGSRYDKELVSLYTSGVAKTLLQTKPLPVGILGQSMARPEPLRRLVEQNITPDILGLIATEHRKGRRLLVLTSNLDAQRAVVWNMGAIADSGRADALDLFRNVLIASASIPGVYPSVMIKAVSGGNTFEEMHTDGGSVTQFLAIPEAMMTSTTSVPLREGQKLDIYVIANNALMPEFAMTTDRTLSVISRAYSTLIKSQTRSALVALYGFAQKSGIGFHVASIDAVVAYDPSDPFGTGYMRAVFNLGMAEMESGSAWKDRPVFPAPAPVIATAVPPV